MRRLLLFSTICFLFFLFLSLSEYFLSRESKAATQSAAINIDNPPTIGTLNQPLTLTWTVASTNSTDIPLTTVYYDQISTPSAVTTDDSPLALGYRYHLPDYQQGAFPVPFTFSADLLPTTPGPLYFRAYALFNGAHLWSPEYSVLIKQ